MFFAKVYKSLLDALNGLKTVWLEEHNFRLEAAIAVFIFLAAALLRFSIVEWALVIIAAAMMLSAEIVNTVMEDICNEIEPGYDPKIKKIKDAAAAFVLISASGSFVLMLLAFANHFSGRIL